MRLLHTSDWHLGRSFHGTSMLAAQETFLIHLVQVVADRDIDAVLIAGDIYDRALPPVEAVELANRALTALAATGAQIVLSSGNHDSMQRLGFLSGPLAAAGLHFRTSLSDVAKPVLLPDEHGEVAIYPLPYLHPDSCQRAWGLESRTHHAAMAQAIEHIRSDQSSRKRDPHSRTVLMAHAFFTGGASSESERDITVGGVAAITTDLLADFDYAALGHLHRPQALSDRIRYSGSPLPYSFSEAGQTKGSWLIALGADGDLSAEFVEAPLERRVTRITGRLEDLLHRPDLADNESDWIQATLTDDRRPVEAMARLRTRFPHTVQLLFAPTAAEEQLVPHHRGQGASELEVACNFVSEMRGHGVSESERLLLQRAFEETCEDRELVAEDILPIDADSGAAR